MAVMAATARLDRLDRPSAWASGWVVLGLLAALVPFFRSDLLFRTLLALWTAGALLVWIGRYTYVWWPLVFLPFGWVAATRSPAGEAWRSVALLAGALGIGALTVPVSAAIVPPAEEPAAVLCLTSSADAGSVLEALGGGTGTAALPAGVSGLGTYGYPSGRAVVVEFDRYASVDERSAVLRMAEALAPVDHVVEVPVSPWLGAEDDEPCAPAR